MSSIYRIATIVLVAAGLHGCAGMNSAECMSSDWSTIGYEDGVNGYTGDRIGQYRKACAKHGVAPDLVAYQQGRNQGLSEYCQPGRGFAVGSNGGKYYGVCDANQEAGFLDGYKVGQHLYVLRSNVNRSTSAINSKERELQQIKDSMRSKEALLIGEETTIENRILLLADLKDLSERTGRVEAEIDALHADRAHFQLELDQYQMTLADSGY